MSKSWRRAVFACSIVLVQHSVASGQAITLTGLSISGPSSLTWGASAAYAATATYGDGSTAPVEAKWLAGCSGTVDAATGVLTAAAQPASAGYPGAVSLAAVYTSGGITKTATKLVLVHSASGPEFPIGVSCSSAILLSGWNLLGNSTSEMFPVAVSVDADKVESVWKWVPGKRSWAFYTPALSDGGATYAASKGYDSLTMIYPGEGFWVNAKSAHIGYFGLIVGTFAPISPYPDQSGLPRLFDGWNQVAIGKSSAPSLSPGEFNRALSAAPTGEIPGNFNTLWTWNADLAKWHFYAPSLEAQGGSVLNDYIAAKGYLGFGSTLLEPGMGFWVNRASTGSIPFSTIAIGWDSGVTTAQNVVVRDASAWASLWNAHTSLRSPQPEPPSVDFNTQMVLGVFLGARSSGCYSVQVQRVVQLSGKTTVEYRENTPGPDVGCAAVISHPFHLVVVPRSSEAIDFIGTVQ